MPAESTLPPRSDRPLPPTRGSFVARHGHLWLGLMLLTLHAATAWGMWPDWFFVPGSVTHFTA